MELGSQCQCQIILQKPVHPLENKGFPPKRDPPQGRVGGLPPVRRGAFFAFAFAFRNLKTFKKSFFLCVIGKGEGKGKGKKANRRERERERKPYSQ